MGTLTSSPPPTSLFILSISKQEKSKHAHLPRPPPSLFVHHSMPHAQLHKPLVVVDPWVCTSHLDTSLEICCTVIRASIRVHIRQSSGRGAIEASKFRKYTPGLSNDTTSGPDMPSGQRRPADSRRMQVRTCRSSLFFVSLYSHATYTDHGGVHFTQFSCPPSARWPHVASAPFPFAQACPKKMCSAPRRLQKIGQMK